MVAACAMNVAMRQFDFGSLANFHYFDIEGQRFAGHRMIGVDSRHRVADFQYRDLLMSMCRVNYRLHAGLPFFRALQLTDRYPQFILGTHFPKGLIGRQRDGKGITGLFPNQCILKPFEQ